LGFSPQISNFPSQQGSPPSRIYCQKSNLCIFNHIDQFSNHFLSASASYYFSNLLWLYIFIYILWGPKNGLQQGKSQRNEKINLVIMRSLQVNPAIGKHQVFQPYHREKSVNFSHQEGQMSTLQSGRTDVSPAKS
jgi:hypothetical protein